MKVILECKGFVSGMPNFFPGMIYEFMISSKGYGRHVHSPKYRERKVMYLTPDQMKKFVKVD